MVKVINNEWKRRIICEKCGARLEYEREDIKIIRHGMNEYEHQIVCPACGGVIRPTIY